VTDAGLKELVGLKGLQSLSLGGTKVTDAGLKELAELKGLQRLELSSTKVTDAGLKELAGLKGLQTLYLSDTNVTDEGVKELRKALPDCLIIASARVDSRSPRAAQPPAMTAGGHPAAMPGTRSSPPTARSRAPV
jgi:hypothetical protein